MYDVKMGSGAMIYIPVFMKIGSIIRKLYGGDIHENIQTCRRTDGKVISLAYSYFIQNKDRRIKTK
jgi:hypothetical protein